MLSREIFKLDRTRTSGAIDRNSKSYSYQTSQVDRKIDAGISSIFHAEKFSELMGFMTLRSRKGFLTVISRLSRITLYFALLHS